MIKTDFKQVNKMEKKALVRFFALALALVSATVVMTLSSQAANAQITPAQQEALRTLVSTGYTNSYPLNPPRTWCSGCPHVSVKYSINLGQLIAMVPDQPRTSLDIVLAPTQHQSTYGVITIQIPRFLLDSKNPDRTDKSFRVTLDGHGLSWSQVQQTDNYRVIGAYFGPTNGFLQIYGTQGAITKAFPTNH
jgi:hypothetical protein